MPMRIFIERCASAPRVQMTWSGFTSVNSAGTSKSPPVTVMGPSTLMEAVASSPVPMERNTRPFTLRTISVTSS